MKNKGIKFRIIIVSVSLLLANPACAFDMGNMMNPSKWMGGNKDDDRYDDYEGGPGYGYPGGGPGYGGGPGGYGGAPGGYGGAPGGYGGAPGGYGGAPGGYGGAPGGYGGAPGGYGGAPGGYGGAPGYQTAPGSGYGYGGAPAYNAPGSNSDAEEIKRLNERIKKLEEASNQGGSNQWENTTTNIPGSNNPWYSR